MLKELLASNIANIVIALILMVMTTATLGAIVRLTFGRKKKDTPAEQVPEKNDGKKNSFHCELNDIMGYDFIQIKTPVTISTTETKKEETPVRSFADSVGIGVTPGLQTSGIGNDPQDEEPSLTEEQRRRNMEIRKNNIEQEKKAKEEGKTELTEEEMNTMNIVDMLPDTSEPVEWEDKDWPENPWGIPESDNLMNSVMENADTDIQEKEDDDEETENEEQEKLAGKPTHPELYIEAMKEADAKMAELLDHLENPETQEEIDRKMARFNIPERKTEEEDSETPSSTRPDENDIPDID